MNDKNYYEILGVDKSATKEEIKRAYFKQSKKYHPDINKEPDAEQTFIKITEAYQCLYDDEKRKAYDACGCNAQEANKSPKQRTPSFDPTWINPYIYNEKPYDEFVSKLNNLSLEQQIFTYEYFWLSFWLGGSLCKALFQNKLLTKMFETFSNIIFVKHENLFESEFSSQAAKQYNETTRNVINSFQKQYKKGPMTYNKMVVLITSQNIYDLPYISLIAAEKKEDTKQMFDIFQTIYDTGDKYQDMTANIDSLNLKRKKFSILAIVSFTLVFIGIFLLIFA